MSLVSTFEVSDKDSIGLDLYDNPKTSTQEYSLLTLWKGKDGKERFSMALYQKSQDEYQEKPWPVKVKIGDKGTAVATLVAILERITGLTYTPARLDDVQF